MAYNYEDFVSAANAAGMMGKFNQQDLETARKNPEFGLSMLSLMKDSAAATTDEQRVLANEAANQLRKTYGNYSIGADGAAKYESSYGQQIGDLMGKIEGYGPFEYKDQDAYQKLMDSVANQQPFSYDPESDPAWSAYKKAYLREGDRATAQALAKASAASGGRPSSHAVTTATQAGNYYAGKLADMIPTLYQEAYNRHMNDYSMKMSGLNALDADRQFDYGAWLDQYNMLKGQLGDLQTQDNTDYSRYLDAWNMAYQREQEELARQEAAAQLMASKGDYTLLGKLYGLTDEQISVLNGNKSTGRPVVQGKTQSQLVDEIVNSSVNSLSSGVNGILELAHENKGNIGSRVKNSSVKEGINLNQTNRVNNIVKNFNPSTSDKNLLEKQILTYAMKIDDTEVGKEVGAQLLAKYGLAE